MECTNTKSRLTAYLAHELPLDERSAIRQHLEQCQECQDELTVLTKLDQLLDLQPMVVPPIDLSESIMAAISQTQVEKAKDLSARQVVVWGIALTACLSLVLLPLFAWWLERRTGLSFLESVSMWGSTQTSELTGTVGLWSTVLLAARNWLLNSPRLALGWLQSQATTLTAFYGKYVLQIALAALGTVVAAVLSLRVLSRSDERWGEGLEMARQSRSK